MRYLEHYLSEEKIDIIFKDFFQKWKFKHPYPEDLEEIFNNHTNENLDWFFDNVFEKTTYVDYGITYVSNRFILYNYGTFACPVEVAYYDKNNKEINRQWLHNINDKKILNTPPKTVKVKIDPDEHMPDIDRSNNGNPKNYEFNFIWDRPNYFNHVMNVVPWFFSYNYYNGFTPGLTVFSGYTPGYNGNGNTISLLYDFKHNKPVGSVSLNRSLRGISLFHESSIKLGFDSGSGRTGMNVSLYGTIKRPLVDYPTSRINIDLFFHILDSSALDPFLYDGGRYVIGSILYKKNWELNKKSSLAFITGIKIGEKFSKGLFTATLNQKFTKNIITKIKFYMSDYLISRDLPAQYRTFLSGSIDSDFQENILDRTGKSEDFKVLSNMLYNGVPGLRGLVLNGDGKPLYSEKRAWSLCFDQQFPYLPGKIFLDIGGASDSEEIFIVSGFHIGPLFIPIYQSWEVSNNIPNNIDWIMNRMRFSFDLSLPIGFLF